MAVEVKENLPFGGGGHQLLTSMCVWGVDACLFPLPYPHLCLLTSCYFLPYFLALLVRVQLPDPSFRVLRT